MARRYLRYATCKTPMCDVYGQSRIPNFKKKSRLSVVEPISSLTRINTPTTRMINVMLFVTKCANFQHTNL